MRRRNGDVVDFEERRRRREQEERARRRERLESTLESAMDIMASDPGFQSAARARKAQRALGERIAGPARFKRGNRVVSSNEDGEGRIPASWIGTITGHEMHDFGGDLDEPRPDHWYHVRWREPNGAIHDGFHEQSELLPLRDRAQRRPDKVFENPSNTSALAEMIDGIEPDPGMFDDLYDEDPEELRHGGEVRHGRKVVWVGGHGRMIQIDPDYVVAIQGNQFDLVKLAAVAEAVREGLGPTADGKPVFGVGYGTAMLIDEAVLEIPFGAEEDKFPLDRPLDEQDLGKLLYTVRDGNHRTFGALIGGETKVWMALGANQLQDVIEWRNRSKKPLPEYLRRNRKHLALMKILDGKLRND